MVSRKRGCCTRAAILSGLALLLATLTHIPASLPPVAYAAAPGYEDSDASNDRDLEAAIEFSEYDYEDLCMPIAEAEWSLIDDSQNREVIEKWVGWERKNRCMVNCSEQLD